ncbi:hypothetical protein MKY75_15670 [Paenibacillus sp. FSL L8-0663]|uniref:hypothetical protein n=1 Tax=Paenibacillus sp. FSL L8-0663 TaxID=2921606 RepID=UPI0030FCDA4F
MKPKKSGKGAAPVISSLTFSISGNSGTVSRDLVFRVTAEDTFATILLDDVSISLLRT